MKEKETVYICVTTISDLQEYIGDSRICAFDYEYAPDEQYRCEQQDMCI